MSGALLRLPPGTAALIQAPMAGSQDAGLALAAMEAGIVGSLPCAMLGGESLSAEVGKLAAAAAGRAWNVNFFCHRDLPPDASRAQRWLERLAPLDRAFGVDRAQAGAAPPARRPFDAEALARIEPFAPPIVSFHFGLPDGTLVQRIKAWGGQVWSTATTVDEARWLAQHGADAVIAQGLEAGGHRGMFLHEDVQTQSGLMALLPAIATAVPIPVIAAGGIGDARGVAAAHALGAAAVQVGTAMLRTPQATTSALHRAALAEAARRQRDGEAPWPTALTNLYTGRPARGLVTRLMREAGPLRDDLEPFPHPAGTLAPLRSAAERAGAWDCSPLWAGQGVGATLEGSVAAVVRRLLGPA